MIPAWILDLGEGRLAAVGEREQVHLQHDPELHRVPATLPYAKEVVVWDGRFLPVIDLGVRLDGRATRGSAMLLGVYAFRVAGDRLPGFGALWLASPPQRVLLEDPAAAPLPEPRVAWRSLAISCFRYETLNVPILDLTRIFAAPAAAPAAARLLTA